MGNKKGKIFKILLLLVLLALLGYSSLQLGRYLKEARAGQDVLDDMTDLAGHTENEDPAAEPPVSVDVKKLQETYPDLVGWIYSPNTRIDLPIMHSGDNSYYLDRLPDGSYNAAGSLFMDSRNKRDFSDRNTVVYGHHMKNGTMFASLGNYSSQEYYEAHPVMYLFTADAVYRVELFAGGVIPSVHPLYNPNPMPGDEGPVAQMWHSSYFYSKVEPKEDDRIITLSTCSYEYDEARYVVLGRLVALPEADGQPADGQPADGQPADGQPAGE